MTFSRYSMRKALSNVLMKVLQFFANFKRGIVYLVIATFCINHALLSFSCNSFTPYTTLYAMLNNSRPITSMAITLFFRINHVLFISFTLLHNVINLVKLMANRNVRISELTTHSLHTYFAIQRDLK